jgi:cyclophilin family peptidyl-prolyl cis-trans isomerase
MKAKPMKAAISISLIAIALLLAACSLPEEAPTPTAIPDVIPTPRIADTPTPPVIGTPTPVKEESASGRVVRQYAAPPEMTIDTEGEYSADIQTNQGTITVELFAEDTPITVNNFVFLARQGFYDGVVFHRVIPNFMIQGGDPTGTGGGGPGYKFQDEFVPSLAFDSAGILAMANAGPGTNGSQFFIVLAEGRLSKDYTIFGQVIEGLDTLKDIENLPVEASSGGEMSKPTVDIRVKSVTVEES